MNIRLSVNGRSHDCDVAADALLLDVIRDLGLTGTKEGCGVGVCGACTVLVGDRPVSSCLFLACCVDGSDIWTVEGLAQRDPDLIEAFVTCEGMQCGICTPGQVVAAAAVKMADPTADAQKVREYMAGNLCRCTGYNTIVEAVMRYLEGA